MVQTRSATSSPVKKASSQNIPLPPTNHTTEKAVLNEPLKLLVGPKELSSDARILLLRHPKDSATKRFLFCPLSGLHELTRISTPSIDPRSVLLTPGANSEYENDESETRVSAGYVNKTAEYMTATPFDLVFLLVPVIAAGRNKLFQPMEDLLEVGEEENKHFSYLLKNCPNLLAQALGRICDTVEAGDEKMYRYNEDKLLKVVLQKAERVVSQGLPKSLEERFVTRQLEMPLLSVKREDTSVSFASTGDCASTPISTEESIDSQSSVNSSAASAIFSEVSAISKTTTNTTFEEDTSVTPRNVIHLQQLRTAFKFILSLYIPTAIARSLELQLQTTEITSIDWTPLNTHLSRIAAARAEAAASRSLGDYSRKRGNIEDDEDALANAEARAEKKRRLEEEEKKKKANLSRGVKDLAKVDVKGMKKMSDFFTKKPAAAKAKT